MGFGGVGLRPLYLLFFKLLLVTTNAVETSKSSILSHIVDLPGVGNAICFLLNGISRHSKCLFICSDGIIGGSVIAGAERGSYAVQRTVCRVANGEELILGIVKKRVLVLPPMRGGGGVGGRDRLPLPAFSAVANALLSGRAKRPIIGTSIAVRNASVNGVAGGSNRFELRLPSSLESKFLSFSRLNCITRGIRTTVLAKHSGVLDLRPGVIPLRRILVQLMRPGGLLERVLGQQRRGCSLIPIRLAAFCERKIRLGGGFRGLARTMFGICGSPLSRSKMLSRIGLLGVDEVSGHRDASDLVTGVETNVRTYLRLSVVGSLPSFLSISTSSGPCACASNNVASVSSHYMGIISFRRGRKIGRPLCYKRLCVSSRGKTLLRTQVRVRPQCVGGTAEVFIIQRTPDMGLATRGIMCAVSCGP